MLQRTPLLDAYGREVHSAIRGDGEDSARHERPWRGFRIRRYPIAYSGKKASQHRRRRLNRNLLRRYGYPLILPPRSIWQRRTRGSGLSISWSGKRNFAG